MEVEHKEYGVVFYIKSKNRMYVFTAFPQDHKNKLGPWAVSIPHGFTKYAQVVNRGFEDIDEITEYVSRFEY